MTALLTIVCGVLLAIGAWYWGTRSIKGAARVSLVAVLGVTASACNIVIPIPSVEVTTTVVLCTATVLGARTGVAVGCTSVIGSSVAGGIGIWTLWQFVAVCGIACLGTLVAWAAGSSETRWYSRRGTVVIGCAAAVGAAAWDVITTAGSVLSITPAAGVSSAQQLLAFLLVGAMFTLVHVVCSVVLTVLGGPSLMHALERALPRLDGGTVLA